MGNMAYKLNKEIMNYSKIGFKKQTVFGKRFLPYAKVISKQKF